MVDPHIGWFEFEIITLTIVNRSPLLGPCPFMLFDVAKSRVSNKGVMKERGFFQGSSKGIYKQYQSWALLGGKVTPKVSSPVVSLNIPLRPFLFCWHFFVPSNDGRVCQVAAEVSRSQGAVWMCGALHLSAKGFWAPFGNTIPVGR